MKSVSKGIITDVREIAGNIIMFDVSSEYVSQQCVPGQFVNVLTGGTSTGMILRRPFSICGSDPDKGYFRMAFEIKGKGTGYLSRMKKGGKLDIMGPLGKGFTIPVAGSRIAVVGGGIGIFPLLFLLESIGVKAERTAILGYKGKGRIFLVDEFGKNCEKLLISTEDGCMGSKGMVACHFGECLAAGSYDILYACGPMPMLKAVACECTGNGIKCEVCLEERMACGIGACLGCACKTKLDTSEDGWDYSHVCKDGPVFDADKVVFD